MIDQRPTPIARSGLSASDAAARLAHDGPNVLPAARATPLWRRVAAQLRDPLIIVLLVAVGLTVATADWTDATVILAVIVINTAVGVTQEVRADRAIAALAGMTAAAARVLRDGAQCAVPAADLVTGDLLVLAEGDIVPADAVLVESVGLLVDESAMTGESVPVDRIVDDAVQAGTVVVRGRGQAVVTATGAASAMGRIAGLMSGGSGLTPLQRRLVGVGRVLAAVAVVLCAVVLALGLLRGQPFGLMAVTAISLVVAAVPESLPAVVTLALALGARHMSARHALVRRLPAVETLGCVTVLATDKTGTLTEGRMAVRTVWTALGAATVDSSGEAILRDGTVLAPHGAPDIAELLAAATLCNDAVLDAGRNAMGDPTEVALLAATDILGLDRDGLTAHRPRRAEVPFDSDRKRMTTVHDLPLGGVHIVCKGAPEVLLALPSLRVSIAERANVASTAEAMARDGLRVLAVAAADHDTLPPPGRWEHDLRLLGLIGIQDPPRASARATIAACAAAGITPLLITGDHPATARAIAVDVGIIAPDGEVVDCTKPGWSPEASVFARATPQQKLDIVQARRAAGDVVAMTGDGVNDGPALHRADIGVAMGRRGTEVARHAADLVLADDDLGTVVAAAEEGRRVYENIRRFLVYALSGGAAEIAVMLAGPFLGLALPLLPAQLLWINLITHGLPGVALGGEPAPPGVMNRPPRPPAESVLGAGLWQRVLRVGAVVTAASLGVGWWAHTTGRPWQSMVFFTLGATQLAVALGSRGKTWTRANPMLLIAIAGALAAQLAGLYLPPLAHLLGTEPLSLVDLTVICVVSVLGFAAVRLDRTLHPGPDRKSTTA